MKRHVTTANSVIGGLAIVGMLGLAWAALGNTLVRLVYNASDSVPAGWYRITSTAAVDVGDVVLVNLLPSTAALAARRDYLPLSIPLLKPVVATAPQEVCTVGPHVLIDGVVAAQVLERDRLGRPMPRWRGCRALEDEAVFLLSVDNAESFDSRYFGPIPRSSILGSASPLFLD